MFTRSALSVMNVRFGSKVGPIYPNWDKPGTFKIRFPYILACLVKCNEI